MLLVDSGGSGAASRLAGRRALAGDEFSFEHGADRLALGGRGQWPAGQQHEKQAGDALTRRLGHR
jgi:hypothetical protein